ncbi:MAG: hypothetical protein NTV73_15700 [Hyphomicrobiales bacterium]|nr:hypothetical protein [Hyphomicrobiales bacterium]
MGSGGREAAIAIVFIAAFAAAPPAFAACPIELATYADTRGVAELEFSARPGGATVSNSFKMLLDNDVVFDGIVQWTDTEPRPWGKLMYKCPDGDVTGDELNACTMWEGVIYAFDGNGTVALLPAPGTAAPPMLLLPALGASLRMSAAYGANGFSQTPWDVFALKGCQE